MTKAVDKQENNGNAKPVAQISFVMPPNTKRF
jgi:hypothetical protein